MSVSTPKSRVVSRVSLPLLATEATQTVALLLERERERPMHFEEAVALLDDERSKREDTEKRAEVRFTLRN